MREITCSKPYHMQNDVWEVLLQQREAETRRAGKSAVLKLHEELYLTHIVKRKGRVLDDRALRENEIKGHS